MKIAIITHYFNSFNYGGVLQAFAMPKYLNIIGHDAVQINYNFREDMQKLEEVSQSEMNRKLNQSSQIFDKYFEERVDKFSNFRNIIPNTNDDVFLNNSIKQINNQFDVFISGSDQVWNPNWFCKPFFLEFVENKPKISYAASIGVNRLTKYQKLNMMPLIEKFDYVSVRENTAKDIISLESKKLIEVVVDPVLLLEKKEWQKISINPKINIKYIFTYFLGTFKNNRDIAKEISLKLEKPIVNIPHTMMHLNNCDEEFSELKEKDAGPMEFLGLIESSHMVITDSFHGMLFSLVFEKDFFVLKRNNDNDPNSMNSRIVDFLKELGLENRIISTIEDLSDKLINEKIKYSDVKVLLKTKIDHSKDFIVNSLKDKIV